MYLQGCALWQVDPLLHACRGDRLAVQLQTANFTKANGSSCLVNASSCGCSSSLADASWTLHASYRGTNRGTNLTEREFCLALHLCHWA